ncbi:MAG: hypothetical protein IPJ62_05625 [Betaproteobacteria bacterium]|nr:hypothetical protein [Betaproteobacteria bacterium]
MSFPVGSGSSGVNVDASKLLDSLDMAFMGSFEAHSGRWGMFADVLYLDVGGSGSKTRDFSIGTIGIPATTTADLQLDLKGTIWTIAGEYRVASDPSWKVDLLAGARYFGVKPTLSWSIYGDLGPIGSAVRVGSKEIDETVWDGIVGVKGAYAFGADRRWSVPFYFDIGTGQSDLTWQAAAGVAYSYHWGDLIAVWRYVDYNFKSDKALQDIDFNGPMLGATFRW